jgi:hypothetical protein
VRALGRGAVVGCRRRGNARVKNLESAFIVFFFKLKFGSVRFFFISGLSNPNQNQTELVGFFKILIALIGYFFPVFSI